MGITKPILVAGGTLPEQVPYFLKYDLTLTASSIELLNAVQDATKYSDQSLKIHLKIDTGLSRFGVMSHEAVGVARTIASLPNVRLVGVSQHFSASATDPEATKTQRDLFMSALDDFKKNGIELEVVQMANSGATLRYPETHKNLVRVGLLAYGFGESSQMLGNSPVMTWRARVTALPLIFGITLITFTVIHLAPGGPVEVQTEMSLKVTAQAKENLKSFTVWTSRCMYSILTGLPGLQNLISGSLSSTGEQS